MRVRLVSAVALPVSASNVLAGRAMLAGRRLMVPSEEKLQEFRESSGDGYPAGFQIEVAGPKPTTDAPSCWQRAGQGAWNALESNSITLP